tara:strand:- start:1254 stop:2066 length:813 start_codon:yes stop_codon:yes gene_type:complete
MPYTTQNNKLFAIKYALNLADAPSELYTPYNDYILVVKDAIVQSKADKTKTDREEANWMEKADLEIILEDLKKNLPLKINRMEQYRNVMKYLVLKIHIETPLRNDLADAKIYFDPNNEDLEEIATNDNYNYILVISPMSAKYINNQYKTKKRYKQINIDFSPRLALDLYQYARDIIEYTSAAVIDPKQVETTNNLFLVNNERDKMNRNSYTKFMKTIFAPYEKKIASNMIRHIIVSDVYKLDKDEEAEKKELARKMGHSQATAYGHYAKV